MADETALTRTEVDDGIALLTLARPRYRNALNAHMLRAIDAALRAFAEDEGVSVAVVAGEGGCFCAGLDRTEMQADDPTTRQRIGDASRSFHRSVAGFAKPLVAAIDGYALGTGLDLAVLSDLRIAATGASFGHPEVRLGGVPLFTPLKMVVGDGWARRLCLDGSPIDAATAERIGLVTEVVEPADLMARALELARSISEAPSVTLQATKRLFGAHPDPETWLVTDHDAVFDEGHTIRRALR